MANPTLDTKNTSSKETIRKNIRYALTSKSPTTFHNIDLNSELFEPIPDLMKEFVVNFRAAGGKYIPCTKENFMSRFVKLVESQKYKSILNTSNSLSAALDKSNVSYFNSIDPNTTVDMVLAYSDLLVARTGSIVFSQKISLYPSIRNLAKDVIVVSFERNIVPDIKSVFAQQQKRNEHKLHEFTEIITPTIPKIVDNIEKYTPLEPRFILFLVTNSSNNPQ